MDQLKYDNLKLGERGAFVSIIAYICLSAIKLLIGIYANSEALRADGLNNATDIAASIAVLVGLRLSRKPADGDHRYGHWKSETIASLVASFIMMAVGLQVLYTAIQSIFQGKAESPDPIAAWTGALCAAVMYVVYRYNKMLAQKVNSQAVMAAAKDNLSDALVSMGTVVGILGSQLNLPWLDPVTAVIVGLIICKTAWDIFREATHYLSDGFDEATLDRYANIATGVEGVMKVKTIKARNYGSNTVIDITIFVDAELEFEQAHGVATKVEQALKGIPDVYEVHVHYEPMVAVDHAAYD